MTLPAAEVTLRLGWSTATPVLMRYKRDLVHACGAAGCYDVRCKQVSGLRVQSHGQTLQARRRDTRVCVLLSPHALSGMLRQHGDTG